VPQDGSKPPTQITKGGSAMRYQPQWSADGKRIAFVIKTARSGWFVGGSKND